jgi:hypothetical protein
MSESTRCTPLNLVPAEPGWTAVVATEVDPAGFVERPVVAWGVHRVRIVSEGGEVQREEPDRVEGVITWRDGLGVQLVCPADVSDRYFYLPPGAGERADGEEVRRQLATPAGRAAAAP